MSEFVISCLPDGSIQHTLKDGILKIEGEREIERVSDIRFNPQNQKFHVHWLLGPYRGQSLTVSQWIDTVGETDLPVRAYFRIGVHAIVFTDTYEDSVELEIAMLNAMRLAGVTFE